MVIVDIPHVHFIFRDRENNPTKLFSEFKKHTAKKVIKTIENNP